LLDAQERRCEFLRGACATLELEARIEVVCGRAERLAREPELRGQFDLVVARSFGAPAITAECAVGFLRRGGRLIVTEPPESDVAGRSDRWPASELEPLGLSPPLLVRHREAGAVILRLEHDVDDRWPRRDGIPHKRPLW
jgi:16S rRNA (guanine527-N7)-methyltransferase